MATVKKGKNVKKPAAPGAKKGAKSKAPNKATKTQVKVSKSTKPARSSKSSKGLKASKSVKPVKPAKAVKPGPAAKKPKPAAGKRRAVARKAPAKTAAAKPAARRAAASKAAPAAEPSTDRLQSLRRTLLQKRDAIIREAKEEIAKYISGENRQLVDTALDEGDLAVVDISEDVNLMRLGTHRKMLLNIDEALRKISEGTYGICEECGEEISERRLGVLPTATLCISCQENKEQLEAVERAEELS